MKSSLALLSIILVFAGGNTEGKGHPEVAAPAGRFRGKVMTSFQGHFFTAFLGIPYALPPVGNLRFSKPQPYPRINTTFKASKFAPSCIQPSGIDLGNPSSEDCLFLNVFTPYVAEYEAQKDDGNNQLKKVFVYIHGGGYFMGSANEQVPGDLVALGDVVVVTLNYRLSWLGFLTGNSSELPGNMGLWDQLMALNWVKDNIQSFGGDPHDVTIGGNSMGAQSVSALCITPYGKGLFTKAFMASSTMFLNPSSPGSSDFLLYKLADLVGCTSESSSTSNDPDGLVKCLRALPSESFSLPTDLSVREDFTTIDGDLFSRPVSELIEDKEYLASVGFYSRDYVMSITNNEGILFFSKGVFSFPMAPENFSADILCEIKRTPLTACKQVMAFYQQPDPTFTKPAYDIMGDLILTLSSFAFLETFSSGYAEKSIAGQLGNSYLLSLNFTPPYNPSPYQGMFHAVDLVYLFDLEPQEILDMYYYGLRADSGLADDDLALKNRYINILTDFMHKGNPGVTLTQETDVDWPPFDLDLENYLSLEPEPFLRQYSMTARRHFWKHKFPEYVQEDLFPGSKEEL